MIGACPMASFGSCVQAHRGAIYRFCYGPRATCYNRFVRWGRAGVWGRIMDSLAAAHDAAVQMIDTSIVRVHQQKSYRVWATNLAEYVGSFL